MAKVTPKDEKRKKWLEERKKNGRVTRASTAQQKSPAQAKLAKSTSPATTASATKHSLNSSTSNAKSKSSPSSVSSVTSTSKSASTAIKSSSTPIKDDHNKTPITTPTKSKYGNSPSVKNNDSSDVTPAKKPKYQYVDAVEKLENNSSVYVPKKLMLFVGNLPEDVSKEQILEHFKRTGGVKSVKIPKHKGTETGKGFAYVEFKNTISHRLGVRLHNTTLGDRKIIVEFAPEGKMTEKKLTEKLQPKEETILRMPFDT